MKKLTLVILVTILGAQNLSFAHNSETENPNTINIPLSTSAKLTENLNAPGSSIFLRDASKGFLMFPFDADEIFFDDKKDFTNPNDGIPNILVSPYEFSQWALGLKLIPALNGKRRELYQALNVDIDLIEKDRAAQKKIEDAYNSFRYHYVGSEGRGYYPFCDEVVSRYISEKSDQARSFFNSVGLTGYYVSPEHITSKNHTGQEEGFVVFLKNKDNISIQPTKHIAYIKSGNPLVTNESKKFHFFDSRNQHVATTTTSCAALYAPRETSFPDINAHKSSRDACFPGNTKVELLIIPRDQHKLDEYRVDVSTKTDWVQSAVDFKSLRSSLKDDMFVLSSTIEVVDDPDYQMDCWSSVRAIKEHPENTEDMVTLTIDNKNYILKATPQHRFYVFNSTNHQYAWINAGNIVPGMFLVQGDEKYKVLNKTQTPVSKPQTVYNLTVGTHVYYVGTGDQRFLVHNIK
jgi:hypothetical protein